MKINKKQLRKIVRKAIKESSHTDLLDDRLSKAETPEEYDEIWRDNNMDYDAKADFAQIGHPQATPFNPYFDNKNNMTSQASYASQTYPMDDYEERFAHGRNVNDRYGYQDDKLEEAINRSIRKAIRESSYTDLLDDRLSKAETPEEYDEIWRKNNNKYKNKADLTQSHHPQTTPFASIPHDEDDLTSQSSIASSLYPLFNDEEYWETEDSYNYSNKDYDRDWYGYQDDKLEEAINRGIRKAIRESSYTDDLDRKLSMANTPEEYDEIWRDNNMDYDAKADFAQIEHPQATPFNPYFDNKNNITSQASYASQTYPMDDYEERFAHGRNVNDRYGYQDDKLEETIRKAIRESIRTDLLDKKLSKAETPEEYDEIWRKYNERNEFCANLSQNYHPQTTPFRKFCHDKDKLDYDASYDSGLYPYNGAEYVESDKGCHDIDKDVIGYQDDKLEEAINKGIRSALKKIL